MSDAAKWNWKAGEGLTEDVDVAEDLRYIGPQRGHLGSVCHVELHDGDHPALLHAGRLVLVDRVLYDVLQAVGATRKEDQVAARLDNTDEGVGDQRIASDKNTASWYLRKQYGGGLKVDVHI